MLFLIYPVANERKSSVRVLSYDRESNASTIKFNRQSCAMIFASPCAFPTEINPLCHLFTGHEIQFYRHCKVTPRHIVKSGGVHTVSYRLTKEPLFNNELLQHSTKICFVQ